MKNYHNLILSTVSNLGKIVLVDWSVKTSIRHHDEELHTSSSFLQGILTNNLNLHKYKLKLKPTDYTQFNES